MKLLSEITPEVEEFMRAQRVFFVATAPLSGEGHVNISPKGLDTLGILSPRRVAYLDLTGSGNETAAHVSENGRVTLMFCAFEGKPNILRLYGRGRVILPTSGEWSDLVGLFTLLPGTRQIILCEVERVQNSCGLAVPIMEFQEERNGLVKWAEGKGEAGTREYRAKNNRRSIDGIAIPGE
jgi:hypothetical protein